MPTSPLPKELIEKAEQWVKEYWTQTQNCFVCGRDNWEIDNTLGAIGTVSYRGSVDFTPVFPMVIVTCDNCGNTVFFNAVKIGLMFDSGDAGDESDEESSK